MCTTWQAGVCACQCPARCTQVFMTVVDWKHRGKTALTVCASKYAATTPETKGAAMLVPVLRATAVVLLAAALNIDTPGAKTSTQAPLQVQPMPAHSSVKQKLIDLQEKFMGSALMAAML